MNYKYIEHNEFEEFYLTLTDHFPSFEIKDHDYLLGLFCKGEIQILKLVEGCHVLGYLSYFDKKEYLFVDYFVIKSKYQGQGLGHQFLSHLKSLTCKPIYLEVELPKDEITKRRIRFYEDNGFYHNTYDYFVPSFVTGMDEDLHFDLMSYPSNIIKEDYESLFQTILNEVYEKV